MASVVVADPGDHAFAQIVTITNAVTSGNPWDTIAAGVVTTATATVSMTGVTTTVANCLITYIGSHSIDSPTAQLSSIANAGLADPAISENVDNGANTAAGGGIWVATGGLAVPGASGAATGTLAATSKQAFATIAIKPNTSVSGSGSASVTSGVWAVG
jgi:uridylate kinase